MSILRVILIAMLIVVPAKTFSYDVNGDRFCLAQNIYFEAGNQSQAGRLAVGLVTLNRVEMAQYPDNVCDVVYQGPTYTNWKGNQMPVRHKCQFSWYCDGKSDEPVDSKTYMETLILADMILRGDIHDFTEGATHYHNDTVDPYWNEHLVLMLTIDNHIFYK
tara:strand:+ start:6680 stop:7165 length:486 start_codon:yes stop_codon:yes gene_type:complete